MNAQAEGYKNIKPFIEGFFGSFSLAFLKQNDHPLERKTLAAQSISCEAMRKKKVEELISQLKTTCNALYTDKIFLEELNNHAVLTLRMSALQEMLMTEDELFNQGSFTLRFIALKVAFEREKEFISFYLKQKILSFLVDCEVARNHMASLCDELITSSRHAASAPKARGSASVYDETRAYLQDMMHHNLHLKVENNE